MKDKRGRGSWIAKKIQRGSDRNYKKKRESERSIKRGEGNGRVIIGVILEQTLERISGQSDFHPLISIQDSSIVKSLFLSGLNTILTSSSLLIPFMASP